MLLRSIFEGLRHLKSLIFIERVSIFKVFLLFIFDVFWGVFGGPLGPSWGSLGTLLAALWGLLGPSWGSLGAFFGNS